MAQPVNLKIQCPHCQLDVWISGNINGCKSTIDRSRHSFNIKDVIATKTVVKPSENNGPLLQRTDEAKS